MRGSSGESFADAGSWKGFEMRCRRSAKRALSGPFVPPAAVLAVLLLTSSCAPVRTVDRPAADLDIKIKLQNTGDSTDNRFPVLVQFYLDGEYVKVSREVWCDGVPLAETATGYAARVQRRSVGNTHQVVYGGSTTVDILVPTRPEFISPSDGETVMRSTDLTVDYVSMGSDRVRMSAGDGSTGIAGGAQSDTGVYDGLDVSGLSAGPGSLILVREVDQTLWGEGFHSTEIRFGIGTKIDVTWS